MTTPEERAATAEVRLAEALARVAELEALLREADADLAIFVRSEWPENACNAYPDVHRRYQRDMDLCYRIRSALRRPGE